jgi:hypothetical protein
MSQGVLRRSLADHLVSNDHSDGPRPVAQMEDSGVHRHARCEGEDDDHNPEGPAGNEGAAPATRRLRAVGPAVESYVQVMDRRPDRRRRYVPR